MIVFSRWFLFTAALLLSSKSWARDYCFFQQGTYDGSCLQSSGVNKVTGGSFPSVSDAFSVNPASLPVIPTPWGIEGILSHDAHTAFNQGSYSLVRGFKSIGAGMATNAEKSFYSHGLEQIYSQAMTTTQSIQTATQYAKGNQSAILGSALAMPLPDKFTKISLPTLGLSLKYNQYSGKWDPVFGFSVNTKVISLGYSTSKDSPSVVTTDATSSRFSVGFKLPFFSVDYNIMKYSIPSFTSTQKNLTGTLTIGSLMITGGLRSFNNIDGLEITQNMLAIQYMFSRKLTLAALAGYVPNSVSAGIQWFL